jgi:hypothetical protein
VNDLDDFVALLRDGLGLAVTAADVTASFDQVPGWDSVHLLWLLTTMEETTGRRVALPDVLAASSLEGIFSLYAPAPDHSGAPDHS